MFSKHIGIFYIPMKQFSKSTGFWGGSMNYSLTIVLAVAYGCLL